MRFINWYTLLSHLIHHLLSFSLAGCLGVRTVVLHTSWCHFQFFLPLPFLLFMKFCSSHSFFFLYIAVNYILGSLHHPYPLWEFPQGGQTMVAHNWYFKLAGSQEGLDRVVLSPGYHTVTSSRFGISTSAKCQCQMSPCSQPTRASGLP